MSVLLLPRPHTTDMNTFQAPLPHREVDDCDLPAGSRPRGASEDEEGVQIALPAAACPASALVDLLLSSRVKDGQAEVPAAMDPATPKANSRRGLQRNMQMFRAKVLALRAFQGLVKTVPKTAEGEVVAWNFPVMDSLVGHDDLEPVDLSAEDLEMIRDASLKLETSILEKSDEVLAPENIDEILKRRDDAGATVFSRVPSAETPWHLPDMAMLFRPPKALIDIMAVGVRPGKWIKLAPEVDTQSSKVVEKGNSNWALLKSVVSSGIAFKLVAKQAHRASHEEQILQKEKVQMEVEGFKSFLLSITHAWEEFFEDEEENVSRSSSGGEASPSHRSPFHVKAIATGVCNLLRDMPTDAHVFNIDVVAQRCPCPFKDDLSGMELEKIEIHQPSTTTPKGRKSKPANPVCAFTVRREAHRTPITVKLWPTGRTQTTGCKDRDMLVAANECAAEAILRAYNLGFPDVFLPNMEKVALPKLRQIEVSSAPLLGSWDLHLAAKGVKMHIGNLIEFLNRDEYKDRVHQVAQVTKNGNAARFNNLSLYVRRECLKKWPTSIRPSDVEQDRVYVNVYEAGKCSVLAAPNHEVAEELATIVTDMLQDALQQDDIRLPAEPDTGRRRKRRNKEDASMEATEVKRSRSGEAVPSQVSSSDGPSAEAVIWTGA